MRSRNQTIMALQEHIHHIITLKSIKSVIDTSAPRSFAPYHIYLRGKGSYLWKDKNRQISQENAIFSDKLYKIKHSNSPCIPSYRKYSLNIKNRVKENKRIREDNEKLYKSLAGTQPLITSRAFKKFEKEQTKYKQMIMCHGSYNSVWASFSHNRLSITPVKRRNKNTPQKRPTTKTL